jgi:hypothetical protein
MRIAFRTILLTLAAGAVSGCALFTKGPSLEVPGYVLREPKSFTDSFRAGVGKADITPPAGFPTGGHGPAGGMARGTWTRLYARAFFFADPQGGVAVFVSCELFAIPRGLSAQVARDVGRKWTERGIAIPPEAITLAATHTHQSPGNFMTAAAYNEFGSKYGGFSRDLFDFLSRQIASAIDIAISDALEHPADPHAPGNTVLRVRQGKTELLQLNRSPRTFMLNADALAMMQALQPWTSETGKCEVIAERGEATKDFDLFGCPRRRAFDPSFTVLEITRGGALVGAMVFYAAHPTVLDHHAPIYSSDFAGIAMAALERRHPRSAYGTTPVYGFFNGAEGDVVARRGVRDVREVVAVGEAFAASVRSTLESPPPPAPMHKPAIVVRSVDLVPGRTCVDDAHRAVTLAMTPVVGAAAVGGGENDRTILFDLGFREGQVEIPRERQGGKLPVLDSQILEGIRLTHLFGPPRKFPAELPLRYVEIGNLAIAAFPAEIGTAAGRRILARLGEDSVIVGLANEYSSYVATAEEYAAQDYMAAFTIWGPDEAEVFACEMAKLKKNERENLKNDPQPAYPRTIEARTYSPGHPAEDFDSRVTFGPLGIGELRKAADEELAAILLDVRGVPARGLPNVCWPETAEDLQADFAASAHRRVAIQAETAGQWTDIDDDRGLGIMTVLMKAPDAGDSARSMAAIWLRPILDDPPTAGRYRFRIELTNDDGDLLRVCTAVFDLENDSATKPRLPLHADCAPPPRS